MKKLYIFLAIIVVLLIAAVVFLILHRNSNEIFFNAYLI